MRSHYRPLVIFQSLCLITLCLNLPASAKDGGKITCESRNGRYNYCRVDTSNNVRLVHQTSGQSCEEGYSWGYDPRGIWVDRGCGGEFEYGKKGMSGGAKAAIIGGIAGAVILGTVLATRSKKDDKNNSDNPKQEVRIAYDDGYRRGTEDWDANRHRNCRNFSEYSGSVFQNDFCEGYSDGYNSRGYKYGPR